MVRECEEEYADAQGVEKLATRLEELDGTNELIEFGDKLGTFFDDM